MNIEEEKYFSWLDPDLDSNGYFRYLGKLSDDQHHETKAKEAEKILVDAGVDEIPDGFFKGTEVTKVKFDPNNSQLKRIGKDCFRDCRNLSEIEIASSVEIIGENSFSGCECLVLVSFHDKEKSNLKTVGTRAFDRCIQLSKIDIPSSLEKIGESAFDRCSGLTQVFHHDIQNSHLETIGINAFRRCHKLLNIEIPPSMKKIEDNAFRHCVKLTHVRFIENSQLEKIGASCFMECTLLPEIEIPPSVTTVEMEAFKKCSNLTRVTFQTNSRLETIDTRSFMACRKLSEIEIPSSVQYIRKAAFKNCEALTRVKFNLEQSQLDLIGANVFENCKELMVLPNFPNSLKKIDPSAFRGCLVEPPFVYTEDHVKALIEARENYDLSLEERSRVYRSQGKDGEKVFMQKKKAVADKVANARSIWMSRRIESESHVLVHQNVTNIPSSAFNCKNLKRVDLPPGLKAIGDKAFWDCEDLKFVRIPDSVEVIHEYAFNSGSIETLLIGAESKKEDKDFKLSGVQLDAFYGFPSIKPNTTNVKAQLEATVKMEELKQRVLGMTVLHIYLKCGHSNVEIIRWIISKHPEAILTRDDFRRYPIHYFCLSQMAHSEEADTEIMKLLVRKFHGRVLVSDFKGVTPFSSAIGNHPWSSLWYLYSVDPVRPSGERGERRNLIEKLRKAYLEKMLDPPKSLDQFAPDEQNGWVKFVSGQVYSESDEEKKILKIIEDEETTKEAVKALAHARDADNRRALDVAIPRIKRALEERLLFLKRYDITSAHVIHKSATCVVVEARDAKVSDYHEMLFKEYCNNEDSMKHSEFGSFLAKQGFVTSSTDGEKYDNDEVERRFKKIDLDGSGTISKEEFLFFCLSELGDKVVLKFMKSPSHMRNELQSRKAVERDVIDVLRYHIPNEESIDRLGEDGDTLCRKDVDPDELTAYDTFFYDSNTRGISSSDDDVVATRAKQYKYILVMTKGDRSLDSIFRSERPGIDTVRVLMGQIVDALRHFHENHLVHADLKMLNVVRETQSNRLKLIDLDASVRIPEGSMSHFMTSKFSSGTLAPEAIYLLSKDKATPKVRERIEYLQKQTNKRIVVWDKGEKNAFLVKSAFNDKELRDLLGTKRFEVNRMMDVWAFGALLYCMCAGKTLFDVDRDDNIDSFNVMRQLYAWGEGWINEKLSKVSDQCARELLRRILQTKPEYRLSMERIADDDFFHQDRNVGLSVINRKLDTVIEKIDVVIEKIDKLDKNLTNVHKKVTELVGGATPSLVFVVPVKPVAKEVTLWNVIDIVKDKAESTVKKRVKICFVCPITYEIPRDSEENYIGYETDVPAEWVKKWGPRIVTTLKVCQFALAVGRMSGLPIPRIDSIQEKAEGFVGKGVKSAVESIKESVSPSVVDNISSVNEFMGNVMKDDSTKALFGDNDMFSRVVGVATGDTTLEGVVSEKMSEFRQEVESLPQSIDDAISKDITQPKQQLIKESSDQIIKIAKEAEDYDEKDTKKQFTRCGLVKAFYGEKFEYVHPSIKDLYERHGPDYFNKKPARELMKEIAVQQHIYREKKKKEGTEEETNENEHKQVEKKDLEEEAQETIADKKETEQKVLNATVTEVKTCSCSCSVM